MPTDAAGNLLATTTPDGLTATQTYDDAGRLLEVAHVTGTATLSRFTYGLDAAGRRTNLTTTLGATGFTYDDRGQLTEACYGACPNQPSVPALPCLACIGDPLPRPAAQTAPDPADTFVRYTYDAVGNRLTEQTHLGTTEYAYDATDRMTSVTPPGASPEAYTYDANGNQTAAGDNTFAWDAADRLSGTLVEGTSHSYAYAGDGRRISTTSIGSTTQFVWDLAFGLPMLVAERDGSGAAVRTYAYGLDLLSQSAAGTTSYYHHDGLGSVVDLSDAAGGSLAWAQFAPFGDPRYAATASGAPTNLFGYAGEYLDPTGFYHLRARQYDASIGRFLSVDPVAPTLGDPYVASYVYVRNSPLVLTDPSGRVAERSGGQFVNRELSGLGILWASGAGADRCVPRGAIIECYDASSGPTAITLGSVVITTLSETQYRDRPNLVAHEGEHVDHQAALGSAPFGIGSILYGIAYGIGIAVSLYNTGDAACGNPLEQGAGFYEDVYPQCVSGP